MALSNSGTPVDLLATASILSIPGSSVKIAEALIAQKQHQLAYIHEQQRVQQEKQRQLIYTQQQRYQQYLRCSGQIIFPHSTLTQTGRGMAKPCKSKGKEPRAIDLVDDVWRLVFYILACDCKDLGRTMQVNKRFNSLIANDALLWKLTYKLTISGSIFGGQKPLLSPTWIREQAGRENLETSISISPRSQPGFLPNNSLPRTVNKASSSIEDKNEIDINSIPSNTDESNRQQKKSFDSQKVESPLGSNDLGSVSALSASTSSQSNSDSQMLGNLQLTNSNNHTSNTSHSMPVPIAMAPGLQMPSPLIMPHHRRIAQSITANGLPSSQLNASTQAVPRSQPLTPYFSEANSTSNINGVLGNGSTRTPASTPSTSSMSSFPSMTLGTVSQVASNSLSTAPIRVIQHHIPSKTLMHHAPAVYWKHQVVEWLEQEKLRCLRLGLFWGFNAAVSRNHGRKSNMAR
ncbi:hypothetical protein FBU30_006735 [Linnemannia zychae]|nr:hypothetical protein FBU30_006735 [Linnemannia zychae]